MSTYRPAKTVVHVSAHLGGHYIAYCQNVINGQWYEFDDQYVTEVHETVVQNAEAYVLFYRLAFESRIKHNWRHLLSSSLQLLAVFYVNFCRKSSEESVRERQKVVALASMKESSLLQFYISREWLNKFNTFAEPGPISNHTFLCQHGGTYLRDSPCKHAHLNSEICFVQGSLPINTTT